MRSPTEPPARDPEASITADRGDRPAGDAAAHQGLFGGALTFEPGRSFEPAPEEVLALLATDAPSTSLPPIPGIALARFRAAGGRIEHDTDLADLAPLRAASLSPREALDLLAQISAVLSTMHAAGQRHGDLGPWSIRRAPGRAVLLAPSLRPNTPAGALLAARLRSGGAPLTDVAFSSGGALAGRENGLADDVYALAALTYWLLSGELPVGQLDVTSITAQSPLRALIPCLAASLATSPAQRPSMAELDAAIQQAARNDAQPAAEQEAQPAGASPPFSARGTSNSPSRARPEQKQLSTVLALLLLVGGLFVLVGALWIVFVGWSILGETGRFGLLFALTAGIAGTGAALEKKGYARSGYALVVLGSQMLWADGGYLLSLAGALSSAGAWAAVAAPVTAVSTALALRKKSLGAGVLAALGFTVFAVCFNIAVDRPGQLTFFAALTLTLALGGLLAERRALTTSASALLVVASQLLWADAALALDVMGALASAGAWTTASLLVFAVTYALALRRPAHAPIAAAIDAVILALCLGAFLRSGEPLGPPLHAFGAAWFCAALAAIASRTGKPGSSAPFAVAGLLAALVSAGLGLILLRDPDHRVFGTLWPFVVLAGLSPFALRASGAHRTIAAVGVALILSVVPLTEAALRAGEAAYVIAAAVLGTIVVFAALHVRRWSIQLEGTCVGAISACIVPSFAFLARCLDDDGLRVLEGPDGPYLVTALVTPLALVAAAAFSRPGAASKTGYRAVEVAALSQLFGLTTIASVLRPDDFFHPAAILVTGTLALMIGVARRHVIIVGLASGGLLLNLWIQYFEKLRNAFPTAALVIGFGLALLGAGVLYERKVRHVLPRLESWG